MQVFNSNAGRAVECLNSRNTNDENGAVVHQHCRKIWPKLAQSIAPVNDRGGQSTRQTSVTAVPTTTTCLTCPGAGLSFPPVTPVVAVVGVSAPGPALAAMFGRRIIGSGATAEHVASCLSLARKGKNANCLWIAPGVTKDIMEN